MAETEKAKQRSTYLVIKAIAAGLCLDYFLGISFATMLKLIRAYLLLNDGKSLDEIRIVLSSSDVHSLQFYAIQFLGALASIPSGYVCARMARRIDYNAVIIMGLIDQVLGFLLAYSIRPQTYNHDLSVHLVFYVMSFAAMLFGARLAMPAIKNPSKQKPVEW